MDFCLEQPSVGARGAGAELLRGSPAQTPARQTAPSFPSPTSLLSLLSVDPAPNESCLGAGGTEVASQLQESEQIPKAAQSFNILMTAMQKTTLAE